MKNIKNKLAAMLSVLTVIGTIAPSANAIKIKFPEKDVIINKVKDGATKAKEKTKELSKNPAVTIPTTAALTSIITTLGVIGAGATAVALYRWYTDVERNCVNLAEEVKKIEKFEDGKKLYKHVKRFTESVKTNLHKALGKVEYDNREEFIDCCDTLCERVESYFISKGDMPSDNCSSRQPLKEEKAALIILITRVKTVAT